jgi:hypothetical protein
MPTQPGPPAGRDWDLEAKRLLKVELTRAGVTYKVLVRRLNAIGVDDNEAAIASRISRGRFTVAFFLQVMHVLGVEALRLEGPGR